MHPPKKAIAFLRWFCREDCVEEIEGDLAEVFKKQYESSPRKARRNFIWSVIKYIRPEFLKSFKNHQQPSSYGMLKSHFKIGWRNLLKNKGYSAINIGGLAIGMAFAMLTGMWIQYEVNFDSFHKNGDRIALIQKHTLFNDEKNTQESTPFPLYDELKNNYPEVKRTSKVSWENEHSLKVGDNTIRKTGRYVDPDFLEMFSFPIIKGDVKTALKNPSSIILTESVALSLFGADDPLGKIVRVDNLYDVQVTAVVADVPANSTLKFEFLGPYEFEAQNSTFITNNKTNWGNNFLMNMVELKEGISMEAFSEKISKLNMEKDPTIHNVFLFLHPLKNWHLRNNFKNWVNVGGRIEYVRLFGSIGIFVLLIACINFMNLSTARSQKRAKEVGIRKTMGSQRSQIIIQFLSESMLTTFIAFLLSFALIILLLPSLKEVGFQNIKLSFDNSFLIISGLIVCVTTGLIAGSYPALYLSSFLPVKVLKGIFKPGKNPVTFRRVLVVSQFAISIGLIVSTIAVFQQINHAKNRSLGYNPDHLISVVATRDLYLSFGVLKQELLNSGNIEAVATASSPITAVYNKWSDFSWDGKEPDSDIALEALMTEWDFEKVAGLKFIMGRPFSIEHAGDSSAVILNESALKVIGYKDPIGRTMKSGGQELTIVGVVEDLLMLDPFKPISPGVILFNSKAVNAILVRVKNNADLNTTLRAIEPIFKKHNAGQSFTYSFVDDDFNKKFALENQVGKLAGIFASLAVFISCLGLFGLASFMAEQRTKEIGIRKILGASLSNLWRILSNEFIVMIILSLLIASPITYYLMENWLQKYSYRTYLSWWTFLEVGGGLLLITLATVSYHALKTAIADPVNSLRTE